MQNETYQYNKKKNPSTKAKLMHQKKMLKI